MLTYGKNHPVIGKGLDRCEIMDCYVIRVGDQCVTKIIYETVHVNTKGIYNSTFYLGDKVSNPLLIRSLWLAHHLAESVAKAFPGEKTKVMTWRESIHGEGDSK